MSDVGPAVPRSSRRRGLRDLGRQPLALGPVGGDLLETGDRARNGARLSYGDLDLRLEWKPIVRICTVLNALWSNAL